MMKKKFSESQRISDFSDAYDKNVDLDFLTQQIYAFNSNDDFFPDPYMGYKIQSKKSKYLTFLEDGSRSIGFSTSTPPDADNRVLLLCYGGSVMFGSYAATDSKTIPAFLGQINPIVDTYEIKNYALPGGVITQNFSHFLNYIYPTLKPGRHFKIIFLFGFNEYQTLYKHGLTYNAPIVSPLQALVGAGWTQRLNNKTHRQKDILSSRISDSPEKELDRLINHINIFSELISQLGGEIELYFQPTLIRSQKIRVARENTYEKLTVSNLDYFVNRIREGILKSQTFSDLSNIFDNISHQIFVDEAHMGCRGNRLLAKSILKEWAPE